MINCVQVRSIRQRKSISVETRVAVTLWFLTTPAEYRTNSHLFGIGRSTVCCIVHHTVKAIICYVTGFGMAQRIHTNTKSSQYLLKPLSHAYAPYHNTPPPPLPPPPPKLPFVHTTKVYTHKCGYKSKAV